jgi:PPOX class probable F420-dependent enzyme
MTQPATPPFDPGRERYVSLATVRRNGEEVATPVWIAQSGKYYYVFSAGDAGKVKRVRNDSRVRLAACDVKGKVKSDWIGAEARIVTDPAVIAQAHRALRSKYGIQMLLLDAGAKLTGRFGKRAYLEIAVR